jgi:hypothetical protein
MNHPKTPLETPTRSAGRLINIAARRAPRRADEIPARLEATVRLSHSPAPRPLTRHSQGLAAAEQQIAEWHAAVEAMLLVVELNGSTMVARIGVMRALNRGYVPEFNSSRKDTHWERQKLARDRQPFRVRSPPAMVRSVAARNESAPALSPRAPQVQ